MGKVVSVFRERFSLGVGQFLGMFSIEVSLLRFDELSFWQEFVSCRAASAQSHLRH
jgi:hypothetical protein